MISAARPVTVRWVIHFSGIIATGLAIVLLCLWRLETNLPQSYEQQRSAALLTMPAPDFEAVDSRNQMFRLNRYLGRHRILLVFFPIETALQPDSILRELNRLTPELAQREIRLVLVSSGLPQQHRAIAEQLPLLDAVMISDVDHTIHRHWSRRKDEKSSGLYLIDRKGDVLCRHHAPEPLSSAKPLLLQLDSP